MWHKNVSKMYFRKTVRKTHKRTQKYINLIVVSYSVLLYSKSVECLNGCEVDESRMNGNNYTEQTSHFMLS